LERWDSIWRRWMKERSLPLQTNRIRITETTEEK